MTKYVLGRRSVVDPTPTIKFPQPDQASGVDTSRNRTAKLLGKSATVGVGRLAFSSPDRSASLIGVLATSARGLINASSPNKTAALTGRVATVGVSGVAALITASTPAPQQMIAFGTGVGSHLDPVLGKVKFGGADVTVADNTIDRWQDTFAYNASLASTANFPLWRHEGNLRSVLGYAPMLSPTGGSGNITLPNTRGFLLGLGFQNTGYYAVLWDDTTAAFNGRLVQMNGDDGTLRFSVGTGAARVEISSAPGDIVMRADGRPDLRNYAIFWHDRVAQTINMRVNGLVAKTYSAACATFAAGGVGFQLFGGGTTVYAGGYLTNSDSRVYQSVHVLDACNTSIRTALDEFLAPKITDNVAPPASTEPPIIAIASSQTVYLQVGNSDIYWGDDNPWGAGNIAQGPAANQYAERVGVSSVIGALGEVAFRTDWRWPNPAGSSEVKAFPNIMYGAKPGNFSQDNLVSGRQIRLVNNTVSTTAPAGKTPGSFLPLRMPVPQISCKFRHRNLITPTGQGQLTFDMWLQSAQGQDTGFVNSSITHEIMIPVSNWGNYGSHPNNRNPAWYDHDVVLGGRLFHVYAAKQGNGALLPSFGSLNGNYGRTGWKFIVFVPDVLPFEGSLNLAEFVNYIATRTDSQGTPWATGLEYLADIEFGVEPVVGTGDIVVWDYKINQGPPPTPAPTPPPPTPPPAPASGLPAKIFGAYYETYRPNVYRITALPNEFNLVYAFNAFPDGPPVGGSSNNVGNGSFIFQHDYGMTKAEVATLRTRGVKVMMTVGGAGGGYNFDTRAKSNNFVASFQNMYNLYGPFDGCDFNNFEGGVLSSVTEMIYIASQLKTLYGASFAITAPPSPSSSYDKNLMLSMSNAGVLDYAAPQFYDFAGFNDLNVISNYIINDWVPLLGAAKVVVGFGANYVNGTSLDVTKREWARIKTAFPAIRGMFCWTLQTDVAGGNVFGTDMKALL